MKIFIKLFITILFFIFSASLCSAYTVGLRGYSFVPSATVKEFFGTGFLSEIYGEIFLTEETSIEFSVSGWEGKFKEKAWTQWSWDLFSYEYTIEENLEVIPILSTFLFTVWEDISIDASVEYDLKVGVGFGVYPAKLKKSLDYTDRYSPPYPDESYTNSSTPIGLHIQFAPEIILNSHFLISGILRYSYVKSSDFILIKDWWKDVEIRKNVNNLGGLNIGLGISYKF